MKKIRLNSTKLHADLAAKLAKSDMSWRALERETGMGPTSLKRLREGLGIDVNNALTLCAWLGKPLEHYATKRSEPPAMVAN